MKNSRSSSFWFLISTFLLTGCYERIEGCLDAEATNFQIGADLACDGCCTYPELQLDFEHKVIIGPETGNLTYVDSIYYDGSGTAFKIKQIRFYISEFHLVSDQGVELMVEDIVDFQTVAEETATVEDNFALIDPGDFGSQSLGVLRYNGNIEKLRFKLGITHPANSADPTSFSVSHPLSTTAEDMYFGVDSGYVFNRLDLIEDVSIDSLITTYQFGLSENLLEVELPASFEVQQGYNLRLILRIDYGKWFESINFQTDEKVIIIEKIVSKLTESFSFVEAQLIVG